MVPAPAGLIPEGGSGQPRDAVHRESVSVSRQSSGLRVNDMSDFGTMAIVHREKCDSTTPSDEAPIKQIANELVAPIGEGQGPSP